MGKTNKNNKNLDNQIDNKQRIMVMKSNESNTKDIKFDVVKNRNREYNKITQMEKELIPGWGKQLEGSEDNQEEEKQEDTFIWAELSEFERLQAHLGHDIEIAQYGNQNISIECLTCSEILYDVEK